jgi:hypothetical protein
MKKCIKLFILILFIFSKMNGIAQSQTEILKLSNNIFSWEVENKIDLLQDVLSDKFKVVTSRGDMQTKEQYLAALRSGNVKHDSIIVEENTVTLVNNTATIIGKGWFHITASGNKLHRHLSFMEVFVKDDKEWKLIALYASVLPDK